MGDSLVTVVAIFLAAILMFVFPLMTMADRNDDVAQLAVQTATTEFVDDVRNTGKLTLDNYDKYIQTITSTGNSFETAIEVSILDDNRGVKATQGEINKIGENSYFTQYTTQVEETLNKKGKMTLKEGDMVTVSVKNTNQTIAQTLRNFFYMIAGNDTYQIFAQHGGVVTVNGN